MKYSTSKGRPRTDIPASLLDSFVRQGCTQRKIVSLLKDRNMQVSRSTVQRRLNSMTQRHSEERPKVRKSQTKVDTRLKRRLVRLIRTRKVQHATDLHKCVHGAGFDISYRTVLRTLHSIPSLHLSRPTKRPYLTEKQKTDRLRFAQTCLNRKYQWENVFFADEKEWFLDGPACRSKVWWDKRDPPPILPRTGDRKRVVGVWGAFSLEKVPDLVCIPTRMNSQGYCDVIKNHLIPNMARSRERLLHDRLPAHHSKETTEWLTAQKVRVWVLPARSADLNPIENLWGIITQEVYEGSRTYQSAQALKQAVTAAWARVQQNKQLRAKLVGSMTKRLQQVVERKGGWADF
jgi:arginine repressor